MNITMAEACALRDALGAWLDRHGYLTNEEMASELVDLAARANRAGLSAVCRCGHARSLHRTIDYGESTRGVECEVCLCGAPEYP